MNKKIQKILLITDKIGIIVAFLSLGFWRADYVVMAAYGFIIFYLFISKRKNLFYHFLIASSMSLVWSLMSRAEYGYNKEFFAILDLNAFPLFAWPTGLLGIYIIFDHYQVLIKKPIFVKKLFLFLIIYWPLLIAGEGIGYHFFNIQNLTTSSFSGLPICNCLHAPWWMQFVYLVMGPLFFVICYSFKLERRH